MAPSLSSLFLSPQTRPYPPPIISTAPFISRRLPSQNLRVQIIASSAPNQHSSSSSTQNPSPIQEVPNSTQEPPITPDRKSFAVATGELFLGLASLLIKNSNRKSSPSGNDYPLMLDDGTDGGGNDRGGRTYRKEGIGVVIEEEIEPNVIWEKRLKDVAAEKKRRVITSPGFSFSAAGLLFPYHLGVAQVLIERGYIKETTPLAGSSAGAIVCAVVASGKSMEDALNATKILAEDCRSRGTAFRLGAVLRDVLEKFLPEDIHIRSNGRIRVAVTQIFWKTRGLLVDQFDSKEDLINAISSPTPGYCVS
ncbi:hypothetical protein SAY86_012911 [Trapa natans]|uniref:Patatin n=1 Tax=Trapa natans TaxID=22666 RepID=A0AAN7MAV6_TRANT|nr:hypothetical protein SAY86_012911 [Trapa natans]